MPQLDPSSFLSQIFWLTVTFSALYFVLSRFALPQIADTLQNRNKKITDDVDMAERFKQDAQKVESEYESFLKDIRKNANAVISDAEKEVKDLSDKKYKELDEILSKKDEEAERTIMSAKDKAVKEMESISLTLSKAVVEKLTGIKSC